MNLDFFKKLARFVAFLCVVWSQQSIAQSEDLIATSPQARNLSGTDLKTLIDQAFPKYDQKEIEKRLTDAAKELQSRPYTIKAQTLRDIESLMGIPLSHSLAKEMDTSHFYYRIDPLEGKGYAQHKDHTFISSSRVEFAAMQDLIESQHDAFFRRLGVPDDEVMKRDFKQILIQTVEPNSPKTDGRGARVRRGMSFGYRGFQGFPIEESFIRISSFTSKRIENFSVAWPHFVLHPDIKSIKLASKQNIKDYIYNELKSATDADRVMKLNMGIVFRPAYTPSGRYVHFPAMKVVMTPIAQNLAQATLTESGRDVYIRILQVAPAIRADNKKDSRRSP